MLVLAVSEGVGGSVDGAGWWSGVDGSVDGGAGGSLGR